MTGSIVGLGSQYVIGLKAVNCCNTADELGEALEQAAGKESVLKALDAEAFKMWSKLGEALSSPHRSTAIAALCQELNRTNSEFPGTHLRLHFEVTEQAIL